MKIKKYRKTASLVFLAILFIGIFYFSVPEAQAIDIGFIGRQAVISIFEWILEGLASLLVLLANIMKGVLAISTGAMVDLRSSSGATDGDAVYIAWKIIRNFVNMTFILMLVVIAFGTIFDTKFGAKDNLFKLLVAALLVNFSLVIGQIVIDISNVIAATFLNSFGGAQGFVDKILQSFNSQLVYPDEKGLVAYFTDLYNRATADQAVLNSLFFSILFTLGTIFSMVIGLVIILLRIPFLWIVLIFSPVAWAAFVFPQTRKLWSMWWRHLIDWSFVLPIYIFFMYLGVYFTFNVFFDPETMSFIEKFDVTQGAQVLNNLFKELKRVFSFIIAMTFMIGAAFFAKKISGDAGAYTSNVQKFLGRKIRGAVADRTGAGVAWKRFKETGQVGKYQTMYGGERAKRLRQAKGANIWEPGAMAKQQSSEVSKQMDALKARRASMSDADWKNEIVRQGKGTGVNALAMRQLLAEDGIAIDQTTGGTRQADSDDMIKFIQDAGGDRTPLAEKYLAAIQKSGALGKIDNTTAKDIVDGSNTEAEDMLRFRQMLGKAVIKRDPKSAIGMSGSMLKILPSGESRKEFLESVDWGKAMGEVKETEKAQIIAQIQTMQGEMDAEEKKTLEKNIEEFNPALWTEAQGGDVEKKLIDHMKKDTPGDMKKYVKNVFETNFNDVKDLITNMDKKDFNSLVKGQPKEFREQLKLLR